MSIYTRISGAEEPRIPIHGLIAAGGEFQRGNLTANQIFTALGLNAAEQAELTALYGRITGGQLTQHQTEDCLMLLELGYYSVAAAKNRLGV